MEETETAIYFQMLQYVWGYKEEENDYDLLDLSAPWYMITDSDLHPHHHYADDNDFNVNESGCVVGKPETYCGLHKAAGRKARHCGIVRDWFSKSCPPNILSFGALLAVPGDSSSTVTIYMIGGYDLSAKYGIRAPVNEKTSFVNYFLTEAVFYKENVVVGAKEEEGKEGPWIRGPPMENARSSAHPVFYKGKIYVFGSLDRRFDDGVDDPYTADWYPWAEVLDLGERKKKWEGLKNPDKGLGHQNTIGAHCILKEDVILLYSGDTGDILSYNVTDDSYDSHAKAIGRFHAAAFLGGILYGAALEEPTDEEPTDEEPTDEEPTEETPRKMFGYNNTIYYFDANDKRSPNSDVAKKLMDFNNLDVGHVIRGGLISVDPDLLYVVTAGSSQFYVFKYRIKTKTIEGYLKVEATLESKGSYYFPGANTGRISGFLAPLRKSMGSTFLLSKRIDEAAAKGLTGLKNLLG